MAKKKRRSGGPPTEFYDARAVNPAPSGLLEHVKDNPSRKAWLIGGGIALGVGVVGLLAWRHYRSAPSGGPEGTGPGSLPPPPPPKHGGIFPGDYHPTPGMFGEPTGPHGHIGQGQVQPPVISLAHKQEAIADLCGNPGQIRPKNAATLLRAWALPAWWQATGGVLAPSAGQIQAGKAAIRNALHDLCSLPVAGLSPAIEEIVSGAVAIASGSRYAPQIVTTAARGRMCSNLPLDTRQGLAMLIDGALAALRQGTDSTEILVNLWTCDPPAENQSELTILASEITTGASLIHQDLTG